MNPARKVRGDASLFTPGVGRRDFLRRLGASGVVAAVAASAVPMDAGATHPKFDPMNHATFAAHLGAIFEVKIAGAAVPFELIEATLLTVNAARPVSLGRNEPFSLVFRAPRGTQAPQQIYEVSHPGVGPQGIFLVPIGPDDTGPRYEAVFN